MPLIAFSLPKNLKKRVDVARRRFGVTRSALVRLFIERGLSRYTGSRRPSAADWNRVKAHARQARRTKSR